MLKQNYFLKYEWLKEHSSWSLTECSYVVLWNTMQYNQSAMKYNIIHSVPWIYLARSEIIRVWMNVRISLTVEAKTCAVLHLSIVKQGRSL